MFAIEVGGIMLKKLLIANQGEIADKLELVGTLV